LVGRDAELALTGSLIDGLAGGQPFVLTVRGERGSGRSALLDGVRDQATGAGVQVVRARGIDGRADPPFATLSTLLRPLAVDLDGSGAGSDALRAAIDLSAPPPGTDDVRRAALSLLTTAARRRPLVLLLDDVDRIDEASMDVVAFVLGRLGVDPVAAIAAGTPTDGPLDAVRTHSLPLPGLAHDALTRVAAATAPCTE
jgi:predicted ATPase